jgi:hypothetical protein
MEEAHFAIGLNGELTGGEEPEVGGQGLGLLSGGGIGEDPPALGSVDGDLQAGLEIGLVEARDGLVGARGDKEGLKEFVVAVERLIAEAEVQLDARGARGEDEMAVFFAEFRAGAPDIARAWGEIEDDGEVTVVEIVGDPGAALDGLSAAGGHVELEFITEIADLAGSLFGQVFWYARRNCHE